VHAFQVWEVHAYASQSARASCYGPRPLAESPRFVRSSSGSGTVQSASSVQTESTAGGGARVDLLCPCLYQHAAGQSQRSFLARPPARDRPCELSRGAGDHSDSRTAAGVIATWEAADCGALRAAVSRPVRPGCRRWMSWRPRTACRSCGGSRIAVRYRTWRWRQHACPRTRCRGSGLRTEP
jgi:hypothetical protein